MRYIFELKDVIELSSLRSWLFVKKCCWRI